MKKLLFACTFACLATAALAQGGTWRCNVYSNGTSVYSSTHSSLSACLAACQSKAAQLTISTGRSHRSDCSRAGNGGLPSGGKRRR